MLSYDFRGKSFHFDITTLVIGLGLVSSFLYRQFKLLNAVHYRLSYEMK